MPDSVNTYNTPVVTQNYLLDQTVYIQDKWRATHRLTMNLGVRMQRSNGWVPAGCQPQTIFIGARCFDKVENVPNWFDLAPRVGLVYDIFGDGQTALKLSANRYYLTNGVGWAALVNPIRVTSDTRTWTDRNGDGIPQLDELVGAPASPRSGRLGELHVSRNEAQHRIKEPGRAARELHSHPGHRAQ